MNRQDDNDDDDRYDDDVNDGDGADQKSCSKWGWMERGKEGSGRTLSSPLWIDPARGGIYVYDDDGDGGGDDGDGDDGDDQDDGDGDDGDDGDDDDDGYIHPIVSGPHHCHLVSPT